MKNKRILNVFDQVDEKYIEEAAPAMRADKKYSFVKWIAIAACLTLVLSIGIVMLSNQKNTFDLTGASSNVSVRYINNTNDIKTNLQSESLIMSLTEKELFTMYDTAIFKGIVTKIDNLEIDYNGVKRYCAIAEIKVESVFRGNCRIGETVSVLLPFPIIEGTWIEDTETVSAMKVGTTGIFMPLQYDDTSFFEVNGGKLALKDVAGYGFLDGERYAFIETENGLVFARGAYESISDATTLEQIEEYIKQMLEK